MSIGDLSMKKLHFQPSSMFLSKLEKKKNISNWLAFI
ncbi:hypothetical protein SCG7086_BT_00120 [Chlamydiales bacterium SCGC AG-110-P3]|nr:hypothetical protein SCG7086_BT_00120 [Chlamydiales bacterium SCGC AG-110-P3]